MARNRRLAQRPRPSRIQPGEVNAVGYSMIPLLMHSDAISPEARSAVRAVAAAAPEERVAKRKEAARLLFRETGLECGEVLDLVGLSPAEAACADGSAQ